MHSMSLRRIAEDAFLLAGNIRTGDEDLNDTEGNLNYLRVSEVIVNIGERICATAGVTDPWVPESILDTIEPSLVSEPGS